MIATGLCLMGGCFALDKGAAVDSYWPAERAVFSPELDAETLKIVSFLTCGGDAENDTALLVGAFASANVSWLIAVGLNRPSNLYNGRINVICSNQEGLRVYADYGDNRLTLLRNSSLGINVRMQVAEGVADIESTGESGTLADSYLLDDDLPREFIVRSNITKAFSIFWYSNARLGTRWCVRAMQSPAGYSAIYSDFDESLTEI